MFRIIKGKNSIILPSDVQVNEMLRELMDKTDRTDSFEHGVECGIKLLRSRIKEILKIK